MKPYVYKNTSLSHKIKDNLYSSNTSSTIKKNKGSSKIDIQEVISPSLLNANNISQDGPEYEHVEPTTPPSDKRIQRDYGQTV